MKRNKIIKTTVHNSTYGDVAMLLVCSKADFEWYVLRNYHTEIELNDHAYGEVFNFPAKKGGYDYLIWMPAFNWSVHDQEVLAHELIHVVHGIFKKRNIDGGEGNGEAFAYLYSYFFRNFWQALKDTYEKQNPKYFAILKKAGLKQIAGANNG